MARNKTLEFLHDTFNDCFDNQDTIKRTIGVINYLVEDSHGTLADVQIGTKHLVLFNKSGEILEEGDHVWVYYWNALADGYIALRCGEAKNIGGGIKNAGVLTERQDTVYNIAKDVAIVDAENKAKAYYTNANNVILINKYTGVAMRNDTYGTNSTIDWETETDGAIDLRSRIANMDSRLWSNTIKSFWTPPRVTGFYSGTEYTYHLQIHSVEFSCDMPDGSQAGWLYHLGIFCKEVPSWAVRIPYVVSTSPNGLENCGLITIYDELYAPITDGLSGDADGKPKIHGALAVCVEANSKFYGLEHPTTAVTPVYEPLSGLIYGASVNTGAMYNIDEYNYAIALTTERDIISGA